MINLLASLVGAVVCLPVYSVGSFVVLPGISMVPINFARSFQRDKRFGTNLKTLTWVLSAVVALLAAITCLLAGPFVGLARGINLQWTNPINLFRADQQYIHGKQAELNLWLSRELPPLPPGKRPFDISTFQAIKALAMGVVALIVGGPSSLLLVVFQTPRICYRGIRCVGVMPFILLWGLPAMIVGCIGYHLVMMMARTYSDGAAFAFNAMLDDIDSLNEYLWLIGTDGV